MVVQVLFIAPNLTFLYIKIYFTQSHFRKLADLSVINVKFFKNFLMKSHSDLLDIKFKLFFKHDSELMLEFPPPSKNNPAQVISNKIK